MIRRSWDFLSNPKTLAVLGLIGGMLAFLWKVAEPRWFSNTTKAQPSEIAAPTQPTVTPPTTAAQIDNPEAPAVQHAEANNGGTAIIAGDHATITNTQ